MFEALSREVDGALSLEAFRLIAQPAFTQKNPTAYDEERSVRDPFPSLDRLPTLEESEDLLIQEALKRTNGNQTLAAQLLGITRQTLHRRLKREAT